MYVGKPSINLDREWPSMVPYNWDRDDHNDCNPLRSSNYRGYGGEKKRKDWAYFPRDAPPELADGVASDSPSAAEAAVNNFEAAPAKRSFAEKLKINMFLL